MTPETWAAHLAAALAESVPRQVGVVPLIYPLLEALQVRETINRLCWTKADIDVGRLVEVLTLNRLSAPQPLYRVGAWAEQTVVAPMFGLDGAQLYDQRFGRALDDVYPVLAEAWAQLAARAVQQEGVDLSVLHWDTTTVYLEGAYDESDWAEYGHSSDGHADNKQVKLGLNVTGRERLPLLYCLLPGATADMSTAVPNLQAIAAFLARPECAGQAGRPLVVGDGKMLTPAAVATAHHLHLCYLGPWEATTSVNAVIRSVSESELAAHELAYQPQRRAPADQPFVPYRGVWRPFVVTYDSHAYADRALVVWSAGKQRLDAEKRKVYLKRLLNRLAEIQGHLNQNRYISRVYTAQQMALAQRGNPAKGLVSVELSGEDRHLTLHFRIDRAALAQAEALDGKYLLGTNAGHLSANQALADFKAQDAVEKSHAGLKGPLQVQPLYLHSDQRIASLIFINLLALLLRAIVELRCRRARLTYSAEHVLEAFRSLYATDLTFVDGSHSTQLGRLTAFQERVLAGLQFPPPDRYLARLPG